MVDSDKIVNKSDSLIELLTAQCADLENLLSLARRETAAAEQNDFEAIMQIVSERSEISRRLETFQQQIGELRGFLETRDAKRQDEIAGRIIEVANLTLAQDGKTRTLLTAAREEAGQELKNAEKSYRGMSAYLPDNRKGLAYDKDF